MSNPIFTIGYSGATLPNVLSVLSNASIDLVIDVRELPISRKRGFSKNALSSALQGKGIRYRHLRPLGSPRKVRNEVRETRNYPVFFGRVRKHLRKKEPQECLREVLRLARHQRACLMCCCSDWEYCHRKCIAEALAKLKRVSVKHLNWETR